MLSGVLLLQTLDRYVLIGGCGGEVVDLELRLAQLLVCLGELLLVLDASLLLFIQLILDVL